MFRKSKCRKLLAGLLCAGLLISNTVVYADEVNQQEEKLQVEESLQMKEEESIDNSVEEELSVGDEELNAEEDLLKEDIVPEEGSLITDDWLSTELQLPEGYVLDSQYSELKTFNADERILDTSTKTVKLNKSEKTTIFGQTRVGSHSYWLDDGTQVYCIEALKKGPDPKNYNIEAVYDNTHPLTKIAYYGYGGPGYNANSELFRLIDGVGGGVNDYFFTHFIACYIYDGAPEPYYLSPFMQLLGYKPTGSSKLLSDLIHEGYKILEKMPSAPENARSAIFQGEGDTAGNVYGVQKMMFFMWQYEPPKDGFATLIKTSSNPDVTSGNGNYSLAGAEYWIYKNSNLSEWFGTPLVTKEDGTTNSVKVPAGTYWIKESKVPMGFELDPTVHKITVKANETATLRVSDNPKQGYVDIYKKSADGSITNGNSNYSLEGAVYGVYSDVNCYNKVGTITTNADGWGRCTGLWAGKYYIKEISPSPGYNLDTNIYPVDCYV